MVERTHQTLLSKSLSGMPPAHAQAAGKKKSWPVICTRDIGRSFKKRGFKIEAQRTLILLLQRRASDVVFFFFCLVFVFLSPKEKTEWRILQWQPPPSAPTGFVRPLTGRSSQIAR